MYRYIIRRMIATILVMFGVGVMVFLMVRIVPGDIIDTLVGQEEISLTGRKSLQAYYGLDQPLHVQFYRWTRQLLAGDLGTSFMSGQSVLSLILARLPLTLELAFLAVLIAFLIGVPAGIIAAIRQDTLTDNVARVVSMFSLSIPVFWQGTMLILVLSLYLHWMPPLRYVSLFKDPVGNLEVVLLPALCLGTAIAATIMRMTRSCMLDVLRQEYIITARAKGLRERVVILAHALKNALIPVVTVAGMQLGYALGGVIVVEQVFTLPGMGRLILDAIHGRDYPVLQGGVLFVAVMFALSNLIVDHLYGWLDPRIRYD